MKTVNKVIIITIVLVVVIILGSTFYFFYRTGSQINTNESLVEKAACEKRGGRWVAFSPNPTKYYCNEPTSDGGKPCNNGVECQAGECIAAGPLQPGKCPRRFDNRGCHYFVENGESRKTCILNEEY